jgi:tripartite-type tricarboxylate transporter receptor subunit TctC
MRSRTHRAIAAALFAALCLGGAKAWAEEPSFHDKTVTMVIGYAAGGATDLIGRLLGQTMMRYLPGRPSLVVRNMPGAEGVTSINYLVTQTKPDGLALTVGAPIQLDPLYYPSANALYDPRQLRYVGGLGRAGSVLLVDRSAAPRLHDRSAMPVIMGALAGLRATMQMPLWATDKLGWNVRWVLGYPGTRELALALTRGEIDMTVINSIDPGAEEVIGSGRYELLIQTGLLQGGALRKAPGLRDAPLLGEALAGKADEPVARKALAYTESIMPIGQWLALLPATPEPIVAAYRQAFTAAMRDAEFLERMKPITPSILEMTASDMEQLATSLGGIDPDVVRFFQSMTKRQGLPGGG